MADPNNASNDLPAYKGSEAPCVYCGQMIDRQADRCPHCRTSYSFAVRKASREVVGDWFYLDSRNPSGRGVSFETLIKMIEKGRIRPDSVVRGPTTHHDWMYAAEAPRLAKYLGMCPHCFAQAKPEDTFCTNCQLNMNERPAEARPGAAPDEIQDPYHKPAYEMEERLADAARAAEPTPPPRPAPSVTTPPPAPAVAAAPSPPVRGPAPKPESKPTPTAAAAAAALAGSGSPDRPSRVAPVAKPSRPKIWIVLILTWVTLIPLLLIAYALPIPVLHDALHGLVGSNEQPNPEPPPEPPPEPEPDAEARWLRAQLAKADAAEQKKDYAQAIRIYQGIVERTGDESYRQRIAALQKKPEEERQARLAKLRERLEMAENLSARKQFDDALAVLRNVSKEDRSLLLSMGMSVSSMEKAIEAAKGRHVAQEKKKQQLAADLTAAAELRANTQLDEALAAYEAIGKTYEADLLAAYNVDLGAVLKDLKEAIAARPPKPPEPPRPPEPPPSEAAAEIADLMASAADLEKKEKFAEALAVLQKIKEDYDKKFWPDKLEQRIRQVQAKKEALEFFGMDK